MTGNINNIIAIAQKSGAAQTTQNRVVSAIQSASARTGVDFSYLLTEAMQESGLNPNAKASSSSATGLYQFIDQTWLKTIKASGDKHGLGAMADKITVDADGAAHVASAADKKAILALRINPEVAANMAAELAKANKGQLERQVGGDIGATEMYLAHFLGAGGASAFLKEMKSNPNAQAANLLPSAADANKSVFYDKATGKAKTLAEVYQKFAAKFNGDNDMLSTGTTRVASAAPVDLRTAWQQEQNQARLIERQVAHEIVVASLGSSYSTGSTSSSNDISFSNGVTLGAFASSPFATMMLAQMDMDSLALDAKDNLYKSEQTNGSRRQTALQTLAIAA